MTLVFYDLELLALQENVTRPLEADNQRRQGIVCYGNEISNELMKHFKLSERNDVEYENDKKLKAIFKDSQSKEILFDIREIHSQTQDLNPEDFYLKLRKIVRSQVLLAGSEFYLDRPPVSHSPWKEYLVLPEWDQEIGYSSWLLKIIEEKIPKSDLIHKRLDPEKETEKVKVLDKAFKGIWFNILMKRLNALTIQDYQKNKLCARDSFLIIKRFARFLPALKIKYAEEQENRQYDHPPKVYGLEGMPDRWERLLLMEGFLSPVYDDEAYLTRVCIPHPVIAYRIAKEFQYPRPYQYVDSYHEFLTHYDWENYYSFNQNTKRNQ